MSEAAAAATSGASAERRAVSVEVEDLHVSFGRQAVLRGLTFAVEPGEIFALMGPSGSGKSVLLRTVMGLMRADRGRVRIDGRDASDPATHRSIVTSMVFQAGALFNSLSVFDNLAFYPREHRLCDAATLRQKVERCLEVFNLADAARKTPAELSGGMRKRVAIARALMMEPQLILYDEPTSELDPVTAANIAEVIALLKEQFAVTSVVVTHDRDLALSICQRVGVIFEGELAALETPADLRELDNARLQDFLDPAIDPRHPRFKQAGRNGGGEER
ncbi:MAG: ABC transporter ATP-binding protein [Opitutales bacterium]